jgi:glycosyltransferase involved in cell wall biosynthesis
MMTLSVCMIAHDEEDHLGEALESVRFAQDLVVVDCGSQDETALIARAFHARVFSRSNLANLNLNKNFAFEQATGDWILCLDADEIVPPDMAQEIQEILRHPPLEVAFFVPRRNNYFGRWLKHGSHYPDWQLRLFRRGQARFPAHHIHERLQVDGAIGYLHHPLDHYPYQTGEESRIKLDFNTSFEALHLFNDGVRPSPVNALKYRVWLPLARFVNRYLLKRGFLDGKPGWEAILMDMRSYRLRYTKLKELIARTPEKHERHIA